MNLIHFLEERCQQSLSMMAMGLIQITSIYLLCSLLVFYLSILHTHLLSAKQLCSNGKVLFVFMFVAKTEKDEERKT
jgi:hypothetical protein